MFSSGVHAECDTKCLGLYGWARIIKYVTLAPLAYREMNMAQPAGATRQSNFLLLNADLNLLFKADCFCYRTRESAGMSAYKPDMSVQVGVGSFQARS